MKTLIKVTQRHINRGKPCNARTCVIGLAVKPHIKRGLLVEVWPDNGVGVIELTDERGYFKTRMQMPKRADIFADRFDGAKLTPGVRAILKPFSFHLNIPRDMLRGKRS